MRIQLILDPYIPDHEVIPTEGHGTANGMRRDRLRELHRMEDGQRLVVFTYDYDINF